MLVRQSTVAIKNSPGIKMIHQEPVINALSDRDKMLPHNAEKSCSHTSGSNDILTVSYLSDLCTYYLCNTCPAGHSDHNRKTDNNSGIQLDMVPSLHRILSASRFSYQAHNIPNSNDPTKINKNPRPTRSSVFPIRPLITSVTFCLYVTCSHHLNHRF